MPWEKSFNEETAVENAMNVFWKKGYAPASISELMKATQLNKGSLYNAFGSKQKLFTRALEKYDLEQRSALIQHLDALDNPHQAIEQFFDTLASETLGDAERKGCFLFNTALDIETHCEEVQDLVSKGVEEIEAFLYRCVEKAQASGDTLAVVDADATAKTLLSMAIAIRVLGRGVYDESGVRAIAEQAKRLV
ncbi:TetR/AcrR family transcriptional regulator [Leucothrix sargassi]|nr:TetR/AcrR family transcriptional regulator [Leucothrix sargassi]